jgi:ribonuclease D
MSRDAGKYEWVLEDSSHAAAGLGNDIDGYYRRVKNAWRLDAAQLAVLMSVSSWREQTARSRDKPRNWIIDDSACLALANERPADRASLARLDLPPAVIRRDGDALLEAIGRARELPVEALPRRLPAPLDAGQRAALKELKQSTRSLAAGLEIAPESALSGKDLELLLRESSGEPIEAPPHWQGWREEALLTPLRRQLAGER